MSVSAAPSIETPHPLDPEHVARTFTSVFGYRPSGVWFAPGRVNLIGEHTDYNGGLVLPIALEQGTWVAAGRGMPNVVAEPASMRVRLTSAAEPEPVELDLGQVTPGGSYGWAAYAAGVLWAAAQRGLPVGAMDIYVDSNLPIGAGLSSSAALSCGVARAAADLFGWRLDDTELAALGRIAENEIAGSPTGVMDQLAVVCGRQAHALRIDTSRDGARAIAPEPFDLGAAGLTLLVIDSHSPHVHAEGEYAARRRDCAEAAQMLGVTWLCELEPHELEHAAQRLGPVLYRRARHAITDSRRVDDVAALLRDRQIAAIGDLLNASHASMRDDFEITVPTVDLIQQVAVAAGALGARMTGGGFGGCVIALVAAGQAGQVFAAVVQAAQRAQHPAPTAFAATAAAGARRTTWSA